MTYNVLSETLSLCTTTTIHSVTLSQIITASVLGSLAAHLEDHPPSVIFLGVTGLCHAHLIVGHFTMVCSATKYRLINVKCCVKD